MTDQIFSRERMRTTGRAAFAAGKGRDEHNMNPGSAAITEWQAGWDQLAALSAAGQAFPVCHTEPGARRHIDLRQGGTA